MRIKLINTNAINAKINGLFDKQIDQHIQLCH